MKSFSLKFYDCMAIYAIAKIFALFDLLKNLYSDINIFRNACTKSGSLRFSQFSGCWLILSVYIIMSLDFPFVRLCGVRLFDVDYVVYIWY
jgi:hypothetical protein